MGQLDFETIEDLEKWRDLSPALWLFDPETWLICWANEHALKFWHATSLSELSESDCARSSPTVRDRLATILEVIPQSGHLQQVWTLCPNGTPQDVSLSFHRIRIDENRCGLLIEILDCPDQQMLDERARLSEATQSTSSMITMMSLAGRVLAQNPAALKCYGPPNCPEKQPADINARFPNPIVGMHMLSNAAEKDVLHFETLAQTRTGLHDHYIWAKRSRDPVTGDQAIIISEEDISEISGRYREGIKRAAELEDIVEDRTDQLRVTQDRMKRGLQLASIWDWKIASNQLFFSPNFIQLLGYDKAEFYDKMRDRGFEALIHPEDYIDYPAKLEEILANPDKPLSLELRFETKSGKYLWVQIEGACYCDETGKPIRTAGLLTDITRKKQLEAKLVASQKLEAVGQLTGGIAHDFNNLLTVIQGNIQLLQELGQADEEITAEVVNAVQRGAELTRHLLAFAGKQTLDPAPFDVVQLLAGMRGTVLRVLSTAVETVIKAPHGIWPIFADAAQTEAALLNLAVNARDAMPIGGTLTITAENLSLTKNTMPPDLNLEAGDYVKISVSDTGSGMSPEVASKAFEPFFTTKEVGKGSGLGLSMVMGFSQQSGGTAEIKSNVGKGTTISLYLPRAQQVLRADPPKTSNAPPKGTGEHLHILEDNPQVINAVTRMATSLGYFVTTSLSVEKALEAAVHDPSIALYLVDVTMPGGRSGVDFALELFKVREDAKLILMSGYPDGELARDITQSFDFGFLPKPFSQSQLADALATALKPKKPS